VVAVLNRVILIGRLTADPELRYTANGQAVASFTLAVDRPVRQGAEKQADFIPIVTWGKTAESATQYLSKGRLIAVEGRMQIRSFQTQDGSKRKVAEVVALGVRFLPDGRGGNRNGTDAAREAVADSAAETGEPAEETEEVPF
jgi:single-strand DNA-binding protein